MADDDAVEPTGEVKTADVLTTKSGGEVTDDVAASDAAPQDADEVDADDEVADTTDAAPAAEGRSTSPVKLAVIVGLVAALALAGLIGWLGFRVYQAREAQQQRELFLQVGRQGATNLTTIDFEHVDDDVKRILDSATGTFYDQFSQRSQPFTEVVKQVKSKSVGKVTEAGLETVSANDAEVLVAVTVNTALAGQPEEAPRAWRMRILVQKVGDDEAKVSNVEFVP